MAEPFKVKPASRGKCEGSLCKNAGKSCPTSQHNGQKALLRLSTKKETLRSLNLHAAALALVGWYLMVPPHIHRNGQVLVGVERSAAIREWEISNSFDTAADCEEERWKEIQEALKWLPQ